MKCGNHRKFLYKNSGKCFYRVQGEVECSGGQSKSLHDLSQLPICFKFLSKSVNPSVPVLSLVKRKEGLHFADLTKRDSIHFDKKRKLTVFVTGGNSEELQQYFEMTVLLQSFKANLYIYI